MEQMTLQNIRTAPPLVWRSQITFNGMGGCQMIDANNAELRAKHKPARDRRAVANESPAAERGFCVA
ncbi:hypothetical protein B0G82_3593 [Paraburkholderia sp. BL17N1]|nr:hypothetical protein B0G82_3593 [Paraburkholderia sp. BL17N1]